MVDVLTHLDSALYKTGHVVVERDHLVEDMIIVASGKLRLYGFYEHRDIEQKMLIVRLPTQSWFGDF